MVIIILGPYKYITSNIYCIYWTFHFSGVNYDFVKENPWPLWQLALDVLMFLLIITVYQYFALLGLDLRFYWILHYSHENELQNWLSVYKISLIRKGLWVYNTVNIAQHVYLKMSLAGIFTAQPCNKSVFEKYVFEEFAEWILCAENQKGIFV